jgi:hypothetical protein
MLSKTFQFGQIIENTEPFNNEKLKVLIDIGKKVALKAPISTEKIIDILSKVGSVWMDTESLSHQKVRANLKNSGMGSSSIDLFFNEIIKFFSKSSLEKRWQVAIGNKNVSPVGLVLHVGATNTLVAGLDGLMDGLLAGNVNFYKLPAWDGGVPGIFIESIFAADEEKLLVNRLAAFYWKGGDKELESLFKTSMDRIIVWGGIDAIMSWKNNLGYSAQLISHGPKYGFGVLTEAGLAEGDLKSICKKIVLDASYWDQKACNSLQTLFIEDKITGEKLNQFLDCLQKTFQETYIDAPPVRSSNDYVDILNAREFIKLGASRDFS